MEARDRKRPRASSHDDEDDDDNAPPPAYGSQEYWEERYKNLKRTKTGEADPDPFHAWYFNYEELEPLLLPLIVGEDQDDDAVEDDDEEQDTKKDDDRDTNTGSKEEDEEEDLDNTEDADNQESDEVEEEYEDDNEDDDDLPSRVGLVKAKKRPISVIEIGCGDVPLGVDLATGIQRLEKESHGQLEALELVEKVVCMDYSPSVIETLNESITASSKDDAQSIPVIYEVADARKMTYEKESFDMIIEKGTLDAMISDKAVGKKNCIEIVGECARILAMGGVMVVVSHLNAHTEEGMEWLDNVIVPGLAKIGTNYKWTIEVHGNEVEIDEANNDDEEEVSEGPGPAVYIIHKEQENIDSSNLKADAPVVSLKFFSY